MNELQFWHLPKDYPERPFCFRMIGEGGIAQEIWLKREDIEGYINAMQKALKGAYVLSDLNADTAGTPTAELA